MKRCVRITYRLLTMTVLACIMQTTTRAQTPTSGITGISTDERGRPLAHVEVVAEHLPTGYRYTTSSSSSGRYLLSGLPPGRYRVSGSHLGRRGVIRHVALRVGHTASTDLVLEEQVLEMEPITISETAAKSVSAEVSHVISRDRVAGLPEDSRQFIELARLVPGVTEGTASTGGLPLFGTNGVSAGALNRQSLGIRVDGGDFTGGLFGDLAGSLPLLAVQEFAVIQSQYAAEFGRAASGMINAVTRRGSNAVKAEAFGLFRHHRLNGRGHFEERKPDYNRSHWGIAVGGPILPNRTHFFAAYERRDQNDFSTVNTGGVFPSFEGTFRTPFVDNLLHARLDHRTSGKHEVTIRYAGEAGEQMIGVGGTHAFEYGRLNVLNMHSWLLAQRISLANTALLESRVHIITSKKQLLRNSNDGPTLVYPGLVFGPHEAREWARSTRFELLNDLSWGRSGSTGTHRIKLGSQIGWLRNVTRSSFFENGFFRYTDNTAAEPLVAQISFRDPAIRLDARNVQLAFYVQDDWYPSQSLRVTIGVRYDVETNGSNQGFVSRFAHELDFIPSMPRAVDKNNVAPRIGIVWDPSDAGTTVLRAGFGLFFDQSVAGPEVALESSSGVPFAQIFSPGTTDLDSLRVEADTVPLIVWTADDLSTPMTRQYSLGFEREMPYGVLVRLDGLLIQGRNLLLMRNLNPVMDGVPRFAGFSRVTQMLSQGRANAKMLLLQLEREWKRGWINIGYTLAKRTNTNDTFGMPLVPDTNVDGFNAGDYRAPAARDERHRFLAVGIIDLPLSLRLSVRALFRSPRPFSAITGRDENGDLDFQNDYHTGEGRNARRGPRYSQVDLGLSWRMDPRNKVGVSVIGNVYNLFNTVNGIPSSVQNIVHSPAFGSPLAAYEARRIEIGLRVDH